MIMRFWVIGGEYEDPQFSALIPGTEKMCGPFESEQKARTEWIRLSCCPEGTTATTRYSIAAETIH